MLINDFYANREVFITGATGFLGKGLVEKLLRDSPKIKALYLLLRGKKSLSPEQRLEQYKKDKVFERIHEQCPEVLNKLHVIQGDSAELGLGIAPNDLSRLQNVSIVFHMAATVRFDESFRTTILLNTRGTHELVKIAENFKNLVVFLHCSTAYCNPHEQLVEEKVYEMPVEWRTVIKIAETYDEETLNCLFNKYTNFYPNGYTFSKNLSEQIIKEYSKDLPMFIFRPSIVVSAYREPAVGWNDNLNGIAGMLVGLYLGIIPTGYFSGKLKLDGVPIDIVSKLTIVAAYKRGMQHLRKEAVANDVEVVNCVSGKMFNINLNGAMAILRKIVEVNPSEKTIWYYDLPQAASCYYNFILQMFLMNMPLAIVIDIILYLLKRQPMMGKLSRRIVYTTKTVSAFAFREYDMLNENMFNLEDNIPQSELATYGFKKEFLDIDYLEYFTNYWRGVKYYVLHEPPEASAAARKRAKILFIANRSIKTLIITFFILYLWSIVSKF